MCNIHEQFVEHHFVVISEPYPLRFHQVLPLTINFLLYIELIVYLTFGTVG